MRKGLNEIYKEAKWEKMDRKFIVSSTPDEIIRQGNYWIKIAMIRAFELGRKITAKTEAKK